METPDLYLIALVMPCGSCYYFVHFVPCQHVCRDSSDVEKWKPRNLPSVCSWHDRGLLYELLARCQRGCSDSLSPLLDETLSKQQSKVQAASPA